MERLELSQQKLLTPKISASTIPPHPLTVLNYMNKSLKVFLKIYSSV